MYKINTIMIGNIVNLFLVKRFLIRMISDLAMKSVNIMISLQMSLVTCENITTKVMEPVKFEFSNKEHVISVNGDSILFECSPGKTLIGPNTTTCMEDGQWYPDPGEVECKNLCKF